MTKKIYSIAASCALAMFFCLSACSDDSSVTSANDDTDISSSSEEQDLESSSSKKKSSSSTKVSSSSVKSSSSASEDSSKSSATVESSSSASKESPKSSAAVESSSSVEKNTPASSASDNAFFDEGWREGCLAKINEYRATENLEPLVLASEEKQACADKQAADDLAENKAHGHMQDCGEFAQNSGPNFNTSWRKSASAVTDAYLKMMWEDEKELVVTGARDPEKSEDYPYIGHYINMSNTSYTKVACGIALDADGKKGWLNINFY